MFQKNHNTFFPSKFESVDLIPSGIYQLCYNDSDYRTEARFISPKFVMPDKLWNIDTSFVNRVLKNYTQRSQNMGVLLNGYRGTGKTILGKHIANQLDLPVLVLDSKLSLHRLADFFTNLRQECVVFVEEYEKLYEKSDDFLTLMDGALNATHKMLFLLTSNDIYVNLNMHNRPSRIYYIKEFDGFSSEEVKELVEEKLNNKSLLKECLRIIQTFETITMDNVLTFISEVNSFDEPPSILIQNLNIPRKQTGNTFGIKKY